MVNCHDCEHFRAGNQCFRGRTVFPEKCGWFAYDRAAREQAAEWDREADEWEADEEDEPE